MIAQTTSPINYTALEKEWLSLSSPEEKADFWKRMKLLFSAMDTEQINSFFEQLYKSANDATLQLELAVKRAETFGFKAER